jgi:hypothetical protein
MRKTIPTMMKMKMKMKTKVTAQISLLKMTLTIYFHSIKDLLHELITMEDITLKRKRNHLIDLHNLNLKAVV